MNAVDQLAEDIANFIAARAMVTRGTREDLRRLIRDRVSALMPSAQAALSFEDAGALAGQSAAILKLLKQRRSQGATNSELSDISLKYTSRVSDLRKEGYLIHCRRVGGGRTFHYMLAPEMW